MAKCTLKVDAIRVGTQGAVTVVNGYVTHVVLDKAETCREAWIDEGAYDASAWTMSSEANAASRGPGPLKYIVTSGVAECIVVVQQGVSKSGGWTATDFAHLSSHQYAPHGTAGAYGNREIGPRAEAQAFPSNHDHAKDIEFTNTSLVEVRGYEYLRASGIPSSNFYTAEGNLGSIDCVLDVENFVLYPAWATGKTGEWEWASDVSHRQRFDAIPTSDYKKYVKAMKRQDKQLAEGAGCHCIIS